jgi:hypothetical protein
MISASFEWIVPALAELHLAFSDLAQYVTRCSLSPSPATSFLICPVTSASSDGRF